jgi:lipoyl-dependent peroxiredoxin
MALTVIHTAHATAFGGRNGVTKNSDGTINVELSVPKAMGGPGKPGTTTPEDLFAAGYAACFGSAAEFVAKQMKLPLTKIEVEAAVGIGALSEGGFGLQVALAAHTYGLTEADATALIAKAHQVCPYSNATRNNIQVSISTNAHHA